ncbi:MAG: hypothetical protein KJZ62_10470 [Fimbriimonadaceae bacterium]|nr:hypothetical protein [Fimbriimonadaceae bacterium]QOJ10774.1 MAG: hypothetical protein HRU74_01420 [Chthonomonadaceae bacterium]
MSTDGQDHAATFRSYEKHIKACFKFLRENSIVSCQTPPDIFAFLGLAPPDKPTDELLSRQKHNLEDKLRKLAKSHSESVNTARTAMNIAARILGDPDLIQEYLHWRTKPPEDTGKGKEPEPEAGPRSRRWIYIAIAGVICVSLAFASRFMSTDDAKPQPPAWVSNVRQLLNDSQESAVQAKSNYFNYVSGIFNKEPREKLQLIQAEGLSQLDQSEKGVLKALQIADRHPTQRDLLTPENLATAHDILARCKALRGQSYRNERTTLEALMPRLDPETQKMIRSNLSMYDRIGTSGYPVWRARQ